MVITKISDGKIKIIINISKFFFLALKLCKQVNSKGTNVSDPVFGSWSRDPELEKTLKMAPWSWALSKGARAGGENIDKPFLGSS
jgi:hypothetical protein